MSDQDDVMAANESERDPMQSTLRTRQTMHALAATAALLSALTVEPVHAATARWSGLGVSANWSDVLNWSPAATPADGDALQFFGSPPRATSMLDLSRSFSSLSFGADAGAFFLHVSGDGSSELGLSGIGLANLTAGTGPIRQSLFADAGSSGGTLRFAGGAGVNLALGFSARPVDLIALGAAGGSLTGGRIVFQDQSSVGTDTFDAVRALGAGVAGAAAAEINLRGNALAGRQSALVAAGGSSSAALGGVVSLLDTASAACLDRRQRHAGSQLGLATGWRRSRRRGCRRGCQPARRRPHARVGTARRGLSGRRSRWTARILRPRQP